MAKTDYFLEIEGVTGESEDKQFKGKIDIESFSWGVTQSGSHGGQGGGGAGKASFQDVHFTTTINKSSPVIASKCACGDHIKKAVLHIRKAGGKQEEYLTITLEDLLVSSYQSGGSGGGGEIRPSDQFSLNFAKIKFDYKPQKPDGSLDAAVTFGYDVKQNTKV